MSRANLLGRIVALVRLTASNHEGEASTALTKALDLVARYDVTAAELPAEIALTLRASKAATWLFVAKGLFCRRAALVGGEPHLWHVSGSGESDGPGIVAIAENRGWSPTW